MKVIDLLNKIANGEEAPKEIKYDTMNYIFRNYDYKEIHGELIDEQSSWLERIDFYKLNEEVEIIEEDKKIEKIDMFDYFTGYDFDNTSRELREHLEHNFCILNNKINEIIEYLEEKDNARKNI